jgi:hypothetical protein
VRGRGEGQRSTEEQTEEDWQCSSHPLHHIMCA